MVDRSKVSAFTLVELLAVLAILGVLVAVLFPVLNRMIESGRSAACIGGLRQLGVASMNYAADSGGFMPYLFVSGEVPINGRTVRNPNYYDFISPYLDKGGTAASSKLSCPTFCAANPKTTFRGWGFFKWPDPDNPKIVYGVGTASNGVISDAPGSRRLRVSLIGPKWLLALDSNTWNLDNTVATTDTKAGTLSIHSGGANMLFCDGHTEYWPEKKIRSTYTAIPVGK